uniref:Sulfatase domain-containing protein n=1 Tax=Steinernema glaseri TaxID=37863 RepID=A0A1I8AAD8_9BILA
ECPQQHLYHHPEEGPEQVQPLEFEYVPGHPEYIPMLLRDFYRKELTKAYLKHRQSLPNPNGPNATREALDTTRKNELWNLTGTLSVGLNHFWDTFYNSVIDRDNHVGPTRLDDALGILTTRDMSVQKAVFYVDWDGPVGPKEGLLVKDLDAIMNCQVPEMMRKFEAELDDLNEPFDKIYEDDLNIPKYTGCVVHSKKEVGNLQKGNELSVNPRSHPLDRVFYDVDMPSFTGPLPKSQQWSTAVLPEDRLRFYFQSRIDQDWDMT